jgi:radical SAM protein with 4Fe4S-binding SPASM domain
LPDQLTVADPGATLGPVGTGERLLSVMFVVQRANLHELADTVALALEVGARSVALRRLFADCNAWRERDGYFYEKHAEMVPRGDPALRAELERAAGILAARPERDCHLDLTYLGQAAGEPPVASEPDPWRGPDQVSEELALSRIFAQLREGGLDGSERAALEVRARELMLRVYRPQPPVDPRRTSQPVARPTGKSGQPPCEMPWRACDIDSQGDLRPCNRTFYSFGNLRDATVREAWTSDKARRLRELMAAGDVPSCCADCQHYRQHAPP